MNTGQEEKAMDGKLYRVFRAFGQEFSVYYQYSDEDERAVPNYMFNEQSPRFDSEGRPFVLAVMECCPFACLHSGTQGESCCGNCDFFTKDTAAEPSAFGLCLCKKRIFTETRDK